MKFSAANIGAFLGSVPAAVPAVSLAAGTAFAPAVEIPAGAAVALLAATLAAALLLRRYVTLLLACATFTLGLAAAQSRMAPALPGPCDGDISLRLTRSPLLRNGHLHAVATVDKSTPDKSLHGLRVALVCDAAAGLLRGDIVSGRLRIRPFNPATPHGRRMRLRGIAGTVRLSDDVHVEHRAASIPLHDRAAARLRRLLPEGGGRSVVLAMAAGETSEIEPSLARAYSRTGVRHLLAVSGLHIAIVLLIARMLLGFLALVHHGRLLRIPAIVAAIWLYVVMCGMPPSAVRAAAMFTALTLTSVSARPYIGLNVLSITALVMILVNPAVIYEVGFRLSFIAVAALLAWAMPLSEALSTRRRWLNRAVAAVTVPAVASVAVAPEVSASFGLVCFAGILITPLVLIFSYIALFMAVAALILPLPAARLTAWTAAAATEVQNRIVETAAMWPHCCFDYRLPAWGAAAIYAAFVVLTILGHGFRRDEATARTDALLRRIREIRQRDTAGK